jgi:hypothetical protein
VRVRSALTFGTKAYRYGDGTFRAAWDAATVVGSTGTRKIASGTVQSVTSDDVFGPLAPTDAAPGTPALISTTFDSGGVLEVAVGPVAAEVTIVLARFARPQVDINFSTVVWGALTPIWTPLDPSVNAYDVYVSLAPCRSLGWLPVCGLRWPAALTAR